MIKLSIKELMRKWKWSLIFSLNLSFGFIGFISLLSFQNSIENKINLNAKQILTADLSINARKKIPESEIGKVKNILKNLNIKIESESYFIEFLSMLKTQKKSQIVSVKVIDDNYPLYGDLELKWSKVKFSQAKNHLSDNKLIAYPELKEILDLTKGQEVTLGKQVFIVEDFIAKDSTQTFKIGSLAPKIFINQNLLKNSNLIQFGSTFSESYLFKLKEPYDSEKLSNALTNEVTDPVIQIETADSAAKDSARQLGFLTDFLNLIAIISILLSSLGTYFLYQVYIYKKIKDYAIYRTLGFNKNSLRISFLTQLILLSFFIVGLSYAGSLIFIPVLSYFFQKTLSIYLTASIPYSVVLLSFGVIVTTCLLVAIPFMLSLEKLSTSKLFHEEKMSLNITLKQRLPQFLSIFIVGLLSIYLTKSTQLSALFILSLVAIATITTFLGVLGLKLLGTLQLKNWILKYSIKSIIRKKSSSVIIFSCITLSSLLLNILPQIKYSIQNEFILSDKSNLPSIFLIDIQEEQINSLTEILHTYSKKINHLSPLIRARIVKVNDLPFERKLNSNSFLTREEEREARFRNRGINLTYRKQLSETEDIVAGIPFAKYNGDIPALSLEYKYAERLGFKLNDILTFDIQGVEVVGKIINFRKVRWISFQPNFFISFDEGPLQDAPKSFIGIVNQLSPTDTSQIISEISNKLPNLSIIDVRQLVFDVLTMAEQMSFSIQLMSILTMLTGFIILGSIIYLQLNDRRWEMNYLKVIGVSFSNILKYILLEFNIITFMATCLGVLLSYLFSFILIKIIFETPFSLHIISSVGLIFIFTFISLLICSSVSLKILNGKTSEILKET